MTSQESAFTPPNAARVLGVASLSAMLVGCELAEALSEIGRSYQTDRFEPAEMTTVAALRHEDERGLICALRGIRRTGLRSDLRTPDSSAGEALVGYDNFVQADGPRCWEIAVNTFRSAVRFNLRSLPSEAANAALVAHMRFRRQPVTHRNNVEPCDDGLREVRLAIADWEPGYHQTDHGDTVANLPNRRSTIVCTTDGAMHECQVSRVVEDWVSGEDPNNGFVLLEKDPGLHDFDVGFGEGVIEGDFVRAHYYDDFELQVDYAVPSA